MASVYQTKNEIVETANRLYLQGLLPGASGNISTRYSENKILITPSGVSKGYLRPDQLLTLDQTGKKIEGFLKPSSETPLHIFAYQQRKDVQAVIHFHPPVATGFSVAGKELPPCVLPEIIIQLGTIPTTEYSTPSTVETVEAVKPFIKDYNALLLKNHGVVVFGENLHQAFVRAEAVEHFAKVILVAHQLGKVEQIPESATPVLFKMQATINNNYSKTLCEKCNICPPGK
ncbi:class II aldolase/adducin family protein [bacterium]|nr:class II aldolase/adducin family protein [bacterium]